MRSSDCRRTARDERVREYFYGIKDSFYPHSFEVKFSDVKLYKIGGMTTKSIPNNIHVTNVRPAVFNQVKIFQLKRGFHVLLLAPAVPDSCLPLGMTSDMSDTKLVPIQPSKSVTRFLPSL